MRTLTLFVALVVGLFAPGCATLFTGSTDPVTFTSDPDGAEVVIGGIVQGRTPLTIPVKRPGLNDQTVTLRLDGYDPVTFQLQDDINGATLLNLFVPIGFVIDAVTGSITKYSRLSYDVDMYRGSVALDARQLERTVDGAIVLPAGAGDVLVSDPATGLSVLFSK